MTCPTVIGPVKVAMAWYVEVGAAAPAADGPKEPPPVPRTTVAINPAKAVMVRVMCRFMLVPIPLARRSRFARAPGPVVAGKTLHAGFSCYISPSGKKLTQLLCMDAPSAMIVEPLT